MKRSTQSPSSPNGQVIDRFQISKQLGEGAFGVVFRAYDPILEREVALKCGKFPVDDKARRRRFLQEAKAAAKLHHPNIVSVFDSGRTKDDQYFIATELIDGGTLAQFIDSKSVKLQRKVIWIRDLAIALAYAHEEGVVHRDLKPENILLDKRTLRPLIADFGLAKRIDTNSSLQTQDGSLLGTPAYMSPEQARGEVSSVGPKSDQYSLAVVLYELLTGECPHTGPTHVVLLAVADETEVPSVLEIIPDLPDDLAAICSRGLEKQAERRYPHLTAFADDLTRWLAGEPVSARPIGRWGRLKRWCRREPGLAISLLATMVFVIATAVLGIGFAIYQSQTAQTLREQQHELRDAVNTAKTESLIADRRAVEASIAAYRPNLGLAYRELQAGHYAQARVFHDACDPKVRGWEWYYLKQQLKPQALVVIPHQATRFMDEKLTSFGVSETHITKNLSTDTFGVYRISDGRRIREVKLSQLEPWKPSAIWNYMFDSSGEYLVTHSIPLAPSDDPGSRRPVKGRTELALWTINDGRRMSTINAEWMQLAGYAPDLSRIDLREHTYNEETREPTGTYLHRFKKEGNYLKFVKRIPLELLDIASIGKRATRKSLVVHGRRLREPDSAKPSLHKVDLATGKILRSIESTSNLLDFLYPQDIDYCETEDLVVFSTRDGRLVCASLDSNQIEQATTFQVVQIDDMTQKGAFNCAFSADGRRIVTWRRNKTVSVWSAPDLKLLSQFTETNLVGNCQFSPSGNQVLSLDDENLFVWDVEANQLPEERKISDFETVDVGVSNDEISLVGYRTQINAGSSYPIRSHLELVTTSMDAEKVNRIDLSSLSVGRVSQIAIDPRARLITLKERVTDDDRYHLLTLNKNRVSLTCEFPASAGRLYNLAHQKAVSSKFLAVVSSEQAEIRLFDSNGKLVWSQRSPDTKTMFRIPVFSTDQNLLSYNLTEYETSYSELNQSIPWKTSTGLIFDVTAKKLIGKIPNTFLGGLSSSGQYALAATLEPYGLYIVQLKRSKSSIAEVSRRRLPIAQGDVADAFVFTPNGTRLIMATQDAGLRVFDTKTAEELITIKVFDEGSIEKVAVSPNGRYVVAVGKAGEVHVIDAGVEFSNETGH